MRVMTVCLILVFAAASRAEPVSFTAKPSASTAGGKTTVRFTVSAPTDVEVAIVDRAGAVVRHLAAGVLGGANPPPEPLTPGLAQTLEWDGKDDFNKPVADKTGLSARVRAGTGVTFGRFIGETPYVFGKIVAVCADDAGNLYVMGYGGNRNQNFRVIRSFDSAGRYLREIMPFPADLPPGAMKDVAPWDDDAKTFHPRNLTSLNPEFYAGGLTFVSASSTTGLVLTNGEQVFQLDPRGGVSGSAFAVQNLWPANGRNPNTGGGPVFLTTSPDAKYMYLSGPFSSKTKYGHEYIKKFTPGCIYRTKVGAGETLAPFVTIDVNHTEGEGGTWRGKNAYYNDGIPEGPVHGLAVDANGNLYAADRQNQCVAVFDPAGKELGRIPVPAPHQVAVHPKTGDVYVLSRFCAGYWQFDVSVRKFKGYAGAPAAAAKYDFKQSAMGTPQMALVASDKETAVYVAGVPGGLVGLVDKGGSFEPAPSAFTAPPGALDVFNRMEVDSRRDEVYVSDGGNMFWRWDGHSGEGNLLKKGGGPFFATDLAVGYDGLLYFQTGESFSGPLERFTRDLSPAPYPSGTNVLSKYIYGRYGIGNCEKGIGVGPDGTVYVSWMFGGWVKYAVSAWGPDGKPINGKGSDIDPSNHKSGTPADLTKAVIGPIPQCNGGVRVDLKGNIYVGMIAGPPVPVSKAFANNEGYKHCTGSIVKFGPEGGVVPGGADMMTAAKVEGALKFYPGLSPFSHPHLGTTCCVCRVPRFDIDRYGRLVIPNATGNFVRFVDNAGNLIIEFGKYGNFDSQYVNLNLETGKQGKPTVATPDIPLAWPDGAGISEKAVYVCDVYGRRVVRADLTYAAAETCEIK